MEEKRKHPHGTHLLLFFVLLVCELFLFGGHGMLYQMGRIGLGYADIYNQAMTGTVTGDFTSLLEGVIGLIVTMVVYFIIAGIITVLFTMLFKGKENLKS